MKRLVLAALIGLPVLPGVPAGADHCPPTNDIVLYSYVVTALNPASAGCSLGETDTDFVMPGAGFLRVRYLGDQRPIAHMSRMIFEGIVPTQAGCSQGVCTLTFSASQPWDSSLVSVSHPTTIAGGRVTVQVCLQAHEGTCVVSESHVYRTVG